MGVYGSSAVSCSHPAVVARVIAQMTVHPNPWARGCEILFTPPNVPHSSC